MKILNLILLIPFLTSCARIHESSDLYGRYAPVGYKNTFDTIELKADNLYNRKIYSKENKQVSKMIGKWSFRNSGAIRFESFFLNLDRDIVKYPELLFDTTSGVSASIERQHGTVRFCVGYNEFANCYEKLEDISDE
jgi:hypothetical protein